jgi:hypothetical protein
VYSGGGGGRTSSNLSRPSLLLLHCSMYVQPTRLQKSLALWRSTAFFTRRSVFEHTTMRLFIAASAIAVSANLQQEEVSPATK